MKIVSLNLNHRTRSKAVEEGLIAELCALEPDLMIFNEFVHGPINQDVPAKLSTSGFEHLASSKQYSYSPGRYQNQILMASRSPIESVIHYTTGIDDAANSNVLTVVTGGFTITGIRTPAYKTTREWESYWDWLGGMAQGEIVIGDFNVDPRRARKRDRAIEKLISRSDWRLSDPQGDWSYKSTTGVTARIDHCAYKNSFVDVLMARYIASPIVLRYTDHAALLVQVKLKSSVKNGAL